MMGGSTDARSREALKTVDGTDFSGNNPGTSLPIQHPAQSTGTVVILVISKCHSPRTEYIMK